MIVVYDEQMKNKKIERKCIFCLSENSSFSKEEHIIPESLGGDRILPKGFVCDQCNQYFGSNVEKNALALSPLAIARILMSIKSKRKRHARLIGVRFEKNYKGMKFEAEGSDEADIIVRVNQDAYNDLKANKIKTLYWSFEEGMPSLVRLLIKMGLEIIATSKKLDVYDPVFDKARMAARNPKKSLVWKVAETLLPLRSCWESGVDDKGPYVRRTEYEYGVYRSPDHVIFFFQYWILVFIIPLTEGGSFEDGIDLINKDNLSVTPLNIRTVKLA